LTEFLRVSWTHIGDEEVNLKTHTTENLESLTELLLQQHKAWV